MFEGFRFLPESLRNSFSHFMNITSHEANCFFTYSSKDNCSVSCMPKPNIVIDNKEKQKRVRKKIINKQKCLDIFLETGIWKVRSVKKLTDEDSVLQGILITLNKTFLEIKAACESAFSKEEIEQFKEFHQLAASIKKSQVVLQEELKLRQNRHQKRKFVFLIDI